MKLIITEHKGMADAIAAAVGNFEECIFSYRNDDDTIVWTDGAVIDLKYRPAAYDKDIDEMSCAEIIEKFYRTVVRNGTEDMPGLTAADYQRLAIIEREIELCDEMIFVTVPTDDSVRNVQAIFAFFRPDVPCRHERIKRLDKIDTEAILEGHTHTPIVEKYLTDSAMRRIVKWDMERYSVKDTEHELTPTATRLLRYIYNLERWEAGYFEKKEGDKEREHICCTLLGLEDLQGIMWAKYNLYPFQLTDSLNYLFHKGLISAPFTHNSGQANMETYNLLGTTPTWDSYAEEKRRLPTSWVEPIIPVGELDTRLLEEKYDADKDECNTYKVAAMLYAYIVEHTRNILTGSTVETIHICPYNYYNTVPITRILNSKSMNNVVRGSSEHFIESRTVGELIDQLIQAEMLDTYGDSVSLSEDGIQYLATISNR